jgi:hypothetical protein
MFFYSISYLLKRIFPSPVIKVITLEFRLILFYSRTFYFSGRLYRRISKTQLKKSLEVFEPRISLIYLLLAIQEKEWWQKKWIVRSFLLKVPVNRWENTVEKSFDNMTSNYIFNLLKILIKIYFSGLLDFVIKMSSRLLLIANGHRRSVGFVSRHRFLEKTFPINRNSSTRMET